MPYSDFSPYAPAREIVTFPLRWGPHRSHPLFICLFLCACFARWYLFG